MTGDPVRLGIAGHGLSATAARRTGTWLRPRPASSPPLRIGPLEVWPPVVLAPMAGVTNPPFRTLCRRYGAGLYVSEMITARALVEGNRKTLLLASFGRRGDDAQPAALRRRPALRRRGGAAPGRRGARRPPRHELRLPGAQGDEQGRRRRDPAQAEAAARRSCARRSRPPARVPVTIKFRIGIDDRYQTYLEAGRIAQEEGCAAVGLHARTAAQLYDGEARWEAIAELKRAVTRIPVLGNGDIWEAEDALRMMRTHRLRRRDRRPRLPGPAVAVPRPRERLRRPRARGPAEPRRRRGRDARARAAARRVAGRRGPRDARLPQALELVHEVLPGRRAAAPAADAGERPRRARGGARRSSTARSRTRRRRCASRAARRAARRRSRSRRATWTTSTTTWRPGVEAEAADSGG